MIPLVTRLARCALPTEILIFNVPKVAAVNPQRHECSMCHCYMPKCKLITAFVLRLKVTPQQLFVKKSKYKLYTLIFFFYGSIKRDLFIVKKEAI